MIINYKARIEIMRVLQNSNPNKDPEKYWGFDKNSNFHIYQ